MTEKKRLQIGLMIHHLENEYASEFSRVRLLRQKNWTST